MKIVYFTLTGNTEMFAKKLNADIQRITKFDRGDTIEDPYILLLPTYEAAATKTPFEFVRNNLDNLIGIVGSGNRNFQHKICLRKPGNLYYICMNFKEVLMTLIK